MRLEQTWRWYGPNDSITLDEVKQTGATGIVSALHHLPVGTAWPVDEIQKYKDNIENAGLSWSVVESVPVHEDIKRRIGDYQTYIERYKETLRNLGKCGIPTVCYNFMPVLDWTRTDLNFPLNGKTGLRYDETAQAAFDLFILKRPKADEEYEIKQIEKAEKYFKNLSDDEKSGLIKTIIAGLPGAEEGYTLDQFQQILDTYKDIGPEDLKHNLYRFLEEIVPVAEEAGVNLAIHPDDPPYPLFGLPRVVSTEDDARQLVESVDSPYNGLTFCTGSYGVRPDNDLPGMVQRLGHRINFIHLRSVRRETARTFYEDDHLGGDADIPSVMYALIEEQFRRNKEGRKDLEIPMRPDHGHKMLDDTKRKTAPGYSLIGRMRGLAELRGLESGIHKALEQQ